MHLSQLQRASVFVHQMLGNIGVSQLKVCPFLINYEPGRSFCV
jgi:hypothetical protein